jgi:hypothetical protein
MTKGDRRKGNVVDKHCEDEPHVAGYAWFALEEALALPDLGQGARHDLTLFRNRLHRLEESG